MDEVKILSSYKTFAVVGMSKNPGKAAYSVPKFMRSQGYTIIPVNPTADDIEGEKSYKTLNDIPQNIEVVNIFRPSADALEIVKMAVERSRNRGDIRAIWLQEGIESPEARALANENGLDYVEDKCLYKEYIRLE